MSYLKFNAEEVTWISRENLEKGKPILGYWVDTDDSNLYCSYLNEKGEVCHHYFDENTKEWKHTRTFEHEI